MEGAGQTAFVARQLVAAGAAQQHRRVAAAVAQQDHLLAAVERGAGLVEEPLRQHDLARLAHGLLLAQVDQDSFRQPTAADATRQVADGQLAEGGVVARLEAGRRRRQDGHRPRLVRAHQGEVARVIARARAPA